MNAFLSSLKNLFVFSASPEQDRHERYLAESTDIYDLERRMRQLDSNAFRLAPTGASNLPSSL